MLKLNIQLFAEDVEQTEAEKVYLEKIKQQEEALALAKAEAERLAAEKKVLETTLVDKRNPNPIEDELKPASFYADLFLNGKEMNNKTYVENALKYREAFMKETGLDPFGDKGVTGEEVEEVVEMLKEAAKQESSMDFKHFLDKTLKDDQVIKSLIEKRKKERGRN